MYDFWKKNKDVSILFYSIFFHLLNCWNTYFLLFLISYFSFYLLFDKDYALEKIFGPTCHFGPFWSQNSAIIFIRKVTPRPLILLPFECYFIYLKCRYDMFNIFLIFWNFVSSKGFLQPLDRIHVSNANFFRFLMRMIRMEKIWGFLPFSAFLGHFSAFFSIFLFFFVF